MSANVAYRGLLKPGMVADITVVDPNAIIDNTTSHSLAGRNRDGMLSMRSGHGD
jgi:N-acyl-D-aspartate/D-glutamate deacylase